MLDLNKMKFAFAVFGCFLSGCQTPEPPKKPISIIPPAAEPFENSQEHSVLQGVTLSKKRNQPASPKPVIVTEKSPVANASTCLNVTSKRLPSGLYEPMPGGKILGSSSIGLSLVGDSMPIFSVASGQIVFARHAVSSKKAPHKNFGSILIKLDKAFLLEKKKITHVYYSQLSSLNLDKLGKMQKVKPGECLGLSGTFQQNIPLRITFVANGDVHVSKKNSLSTKASALALSSSSGRGAH